MNIGHTLGYGREEEIFIATDGYYQLNEVSSMIVSDIMPYDDVTIVCVRLKQFVS